MAKNLSKGLDADPIYPNEYETLKNGLMSQERFKEALPIILGCSLGRRYSDLKTITYAMIERNEFDFKERKTGKLISLAVSDKTHAELLEILTEIDYYSESKAITIAVQSMNRRLKKLQAEFNLGEGMKWSSHSLRKCAGHRLLEAHGHGDNALFMISQFYNHSDLKLLKVYLKMTQNKVKEFAKVL